MGLGLKMMNKEEQGEEVAINFESSSVAEYKYGNDMSKSIKPEATFIGSQCLGVSFKDHSRHYP